MRRCDVATQVCLALRNAWRRLLFTFSLEMYHASEVLFIYMSSNSLPLSCREYVFYFFPKLGSLSSLSFTHLETYAHWEG